MAILAFFMEGGFNVHPTREGWNPVVKLAKREKPAEYRAGDRNVSTISVRGCMFVHCEYFERSKVLGGDHSVQATCPFSEPWMLQLRLRLLLRSAGSFE